MTEETADTKTGSAFQNDQVEEERERGFFSFPARVTVVRWSHSGVSLQEISQLAMVDMRKHF